MKTYDGMHTPKIEITMHSPSTNLPRLRAAVMPIANPTPVPNRIDSTPIRKEVSRHFSIIGFIGAPLYSDVPFPKLPDKSIEM